MVPQQSNGLPYRLSTIERQELELARRRAEKAAEGKRANAAQARAKRRASRPRLEDRQSEQGEGGEGSNGEEDDLEAKLANTKDEKEAKRLRRQAHSLSSALAALFVFPGGVVYHHSCIKFWHLFLLRPCHSSLYRGHPAVIVPWCDLKT